MRVLAGLACIALLAFVGYFFWGEYQKGRDQELHAIFAECDRIMSDPRDVNSMGPAELLHDKKALDRCRTTITGSPAN